MTLTDKQIEALPSRYVHRKSHLPYELAKTAVNTLAPHVTSANKYRKWIKSTNSYYMPVHPERVYPDFDWSEFLGSEITSMIELVAERRQRAKLGYRPMWDAIRWAQRYCHANGIKRRSDWIERYAVDDTIPQDIPLHPDRVYKQSDFPGFAVWCGKNPSAIVDAAQRVTPILTLMHPVNVPQNVAELVQWSEGVGDLRTRWPKQSDFDRIIGCWILEKDLMSDVDRILTENGHYDGERYIFPNLNQVTWELNSILEMIRL